MSKRLILSLLLLVILNLYLPLQAFAQWWPPPGVEAPTFKWDGSSWIWVDYCVDPNTANPACAFCSGWEYRESCVLPGTIPIQWIQWAITGTRWDWFVREPGIYTTNAITLVVASDSDVVIDYDGFEALQPEISCSDSVIRIWYALDYHMPPPPDDPAWVLAEDLNSHDDTLYDSWDLEVGVHFKKWSLIEVKKSYPSGDYSDDATVYFRTYDPCVGSHPFSVVVHYQPRESVDLPLVWCVTPNNGLNSDTVFVEVEGTNFYPGLNIKLSRVGLLNIVGENTTVLDTNHVTTTFDLTGREPGRWDLVVTNPGGSSDTLIGAFTVIPLVWRVSPAHGMNNDTVFVEVEGTNFYPGLSVELNRVGLTSIVGENTTVLDTNHVTTTFDLTGREPGRWDLVISNPDGSADTLVGAFCVIQFGVTAAVLVSVADASAPIRDIQADMWVSSWFDTLTLYKDVHLFYKAKAPDKTKISIPESELIPYPIISMITNGWRRLSINHYTGGVEETSLLEEGNITLTEFNIMDLNYNPYEFLAHHTIDLSGSYLDGEDTVYIVEAVPTWSDKLYSKLDIHVKYKQGLVKKLVTYVADSMTAETEVTEENLIDGQFWIATRFENKVNFKDTLLLTEVVLDSIQINVGISDSEFVVENGYLGQGSPTWNDSLTKDDPQQMPPLGKVGETSEGPPDAIWEEWQQDGVYKPNPVFLLHGFCMGKPESWEKAVNALKGHYKYDSGGYSIYLRTPEFYDKYGSVDGPGGWASYVSAWVDDRLQDIGIPGKKVNLVGHSHGGLAAREYVVQNSGFDYGDPDAWKKVEKIITIGTPNRGCLVAAFASEIEAIMASETPYVMPINSSFSFVHYLDMGNVFLVVSLCPDAVGSEAAHDADFRSSFIKNLNEGDQHSSSIKYYAVYGRKVPWWHVINQGDGFIEYWSQIGIPGLPQDRIYGITASHIEETKVVVETGVLMKLLDDTKPDVEITPIDPLQDCVGYDCSLKVRLREEYLPATTELDVNIHKIPDFETIASIDTWFHPDPDWTAEGEGSSHRGILDTLIQFPGPGAYGILVSTTNPGGLVDVDYIELRLGVDLLVWVWGTGRARPGFVKTYTIQCKNLGTVTASDILVTFDNNFKSETWHVTTLPAGESMSFSTTIQIPEATPDGTEILSVATVSSTDEDIDPSNNTDTEAETVTRSIDPNDKEVYPPGFEANGFIPRDQTLKYTVFFENLKTASDSAIYITVKDTLDSDLDWRTLSLGPISHPEKCTSYFDPLTGVITWYFDEILLPPNKVPPEGEGCVTYSIKPKYFLESGTQIKNRATIRFDYNPWMYAPMDSSYIVNTVDILAPNTFVCALPDSQEADSFEVFWSGQDDSLGSGIKSYTIYISVDDAPYELWLVGSTDTTAIFQGEFGHTYSFYSIGEDNVGNIEEPPLLPDASTRIVSKMGSISGVVSDSLGGLSGITVDLLDSTSTMIGVTYTDESGYYLFDSLFIGSYSVSIVTPSGFVADQETKSVTVTSDADSIVDFLLHRLQIVPSQRSVGYWKHQLNVLLSGKGKAQETLDQMSGYIDRIRVHFNGNGINPINIFMVDQPATIIDSLNTLHTLLSPSDNSVMIEKAKQQLTALMLNVVSDKLSQSEKISEDSATVSQAITYCYQLICDADSVNDERAKDIADRINNGLIVSAEVIPLSTPEITYYVAGEYISQEEKLLPQNFSLSYNYPNPFNPQTVIEYALPQDCHIKLTIYNILGQKVKVLVDEYQTAGYKKVRWDGKDSEGNEVASGVYFYKIKADKFTQAKKMVIIK